MEKRKDLDLDDEPEDGMLPDMPAASPMGKAARKILGIRDEIENVNKDLDEKIKAAKKSLIELMRKDGKESIVVDGNLFTAIHKEASDEIRIKTKKTRKEKDND